MATPTPTDRPLPSVSVVVPTYQRRAQLDAALGELLDRTAPAEVVVVDDGSTDGTAELLEDRAAAEPRLRPLRVPNGGPMAARVAGARHATGAVVLLLDDDVMPEAGVVDGHARRHAQDDRLVLLGAMPVGPGPVDRRSYPRDNYGRGYEDAVAAWRADPATVLPSLWAGHLSVRREALLAVADRLVGGPRHFHEDMDLGLFLLEDGLHGAFDPSLRAEHRYERAPDRYMIDAFRSGQGLAQTQRRHPAALPTDPLGGGGRAAALRRRLAGPSRAAGAARRLGALGVAVLGHLRLLDAQRAVASRLWRVEQQRGYRTEMESSR